MADYCTLRQVKDRLAGQWSVDRDTGSGSTRDEILDELITECSRGFDREVGVPDNTFGTGTAVTRRFSGRGGPLLAIGNWDTLTSVTLWHDQAGASTQAMHLTDKTNASYIQRRPFEGPPYTELYNLGTWPTDEYGIGNVVIVGNQSTPVDVAGAVAWWASRAFLKRQGTATGNTIERADGSVLTLSEDIPPETKRIIKHYQARFTTKGKFGVGEIVLARPTYGAYSAPEQVA